MVSPNVPLELSIDGRAPDHVWLPSEPRIYAVEPGFHDIRVLLPQQTCSLNESIDEPQSAHANHRVLTLPGTVVNYSVHTDCSSVLDTWGARVTVENERPDIDGFLLTLTSPEFGATEVALPPAGSVRLPPLHVGWYRARLTGIHPSCRVSGIGAPGWAHDSIQIRPHSGVMFYRVNC
jgi:hypothetical protein